MVVQNTWIGAASAAALTLTQFAHAGACTGTNCQAPNNTLALNSNGTEFRAADNFAFASADIITNVCWQGLYADLVSDPQVDCSAGTTDAFTIRILSDGGECFPVFETASFTQGSNLLNVTRTDTGQTIGDFTVFQYTAELSGGAIVEGEICTWIEITNQITSGNPNCSWFWSASDEGDGFRVQDITIADPYTADDIDNTGDLAFCLTTSFGNEIQLPKCNCPQVTSVCTTDEAACQLPDQSGTGSSGITFTTADNFVLSAATSLTGACWWGSYRLGSNAADCSDNPPQPENFIIRIRSTTPNFLPGTVLGEFRSDNGTLINFQKTPTTLVTGDTPPLPEYSFTADFSTPLAVQGNTCLWIEIIGPEATPPTGCRFRWSNTTGTDGLSFQDGAPIDGYDAGDVIGTDKAFCIKSTTNATLADTPQCFDTSGPPQCDAGFDTLTQSADGLVVAGGISCAAANLSQSQAFARSMNVGPAPFEVCSVDFGATNSGSEFTAALNLFSDINGGDPLQADLTLLGTTNVVIPATGGANQMLTATFNPPICVAANTQLVVELAMTFNPPPHDGFASFAANPFGQSGPTYIRSDACGITEFTDLADVGAGFPNSHWVLAVCGNSGACDGQCQGGGDSCPADIAPAAGGNCSTDGNGTVDAADLGQLLANWGNPINDCADIAPPGSPNGVVDAADLGQLLANWGQCS
jgi:hypothetical protein